MHILCLNGPNLNLLGLREPSIYGRESLSDLEVRLRHLADQHNTKLTFFQSNHEGALIDKLHWAFHERLDGIIFNPAAYTHTSIALRDAISSIDIPVIEVHISNILERESFRHHSFISDVAIDQILGHGLKGYEMALEKFLGRKGEKECQN
ncbi:type II 3-dehydroquinate dehydratase [Paenisporosarcina cavernae]|uniref:3-dehydroquinate dehydratase n=1 Tax=Paenisporosarcina cavernae TaxID=2320858 RepID=A0A385YSS7_9BACL|nr:type II 3-dehydroquinate dehydratase [Paenisporosarcina cavernae]AYC29551.1 type II 3-dehydroquinate dehydratase [Paenisporosarcina cavernae]